MPPQWCSEDRVTDKTRASENPDMALVLQLVGEPGGESIEFDWLAHSYEARHQDASKDFSLSEWGETLTPGAAQRAAMTWLKKGR